MDVSTAIFGAGCFWGIEAAFRKVEGVTGTEAGYSGGTTANPTYQDVCSGTTGHAEVVRVTFDPARVTYDELLDVFWAIHDPTQLNRQGPDVGTQYRTAIFFLDETQEEQARASKEQRLAAGRRIATEVSPAATFWPAEEYHQQYLAKRGQDACATTIRGSS